MVSVTVVWRQGFPPTPTLRFRGLPRGRQPIVYPTVDSHKGKFRGQQAELVAALEDASGRIVRLGRFHWLPRPTVPCLPLVILLSVVAFSCLAAIGCGYTHIFVTVVAAPVAATRYESAIRARPGVADHVKA